LHKVKIPKTAANAAVKSAEFLLKGGRPGIAALLAVVFAGACWIFTPGGSVTSTEGPEERKPDPKTASRTRRAQAGPDERLGRELGLVGKDFDHVAKRLFG
jgi:hypothetical protein